MFYRAKISKVSDTKIVTPIVESRGKHNMLYLSLAWVMALVATGASIFFIEILGNPVATLCWVERMLIFGLLLLLTMGVIDRNFSVKRFGLPFLVVGIPASFFQQLVHLDIIKVAEESCTIGFICTAKYFELFGFITQATLCLTAFLVIAFCLYKIKN